ncbi:hypothetical protein [Paradevosia shaoguanensis]|uniref:Uncharacterized protein n=1 Tax=Paradevosia shaoguanensis TaxID=1335043 RepID=A0AA41UH98_9HYPH|nr:hypothetical protein [Paradevosia shaoguanensis]MCF1743658.1 hypothetical protein [Paradevosia shaoguanensis]MCI0128141.1 hypothetical protein [Paradevosia shaoguanensis]QMV01040.1 hypothetical protein GHV40_05905 [Devosia sp. D6-9]
MRDRSSVVQMVLTVAFAALMFVLVFAAANTEVPGPFSGVLTPQTTQAR